MNLSLLLSQLFNGLQTGSIYALVALGYSMVYGIILLLNFAHGDIIMVGAYAAFYAMTNFHLHPIVSVIIAVITSTLLGVVIEKVAYTPLRKAPRLSLLITAIGISFLLENGAQLLFGSDTKSMDPIVPRPWPEHRAAPIVCSHLDDPCGIVIVPEICSLAGSRICRRRGYCREK